MIKKTGAEELEARWRKVLEDFTASGYGVSQYCQDHKVSKASLYKWSQQLGIPIKNRPALANPPQINKDNVPTSSVSQEEAPFSFVELKLSPSNTEAAFPLKLELLFAQERRLKVEAASTWEQLVGMIKTLVS